MTPQHHLKRSLGTLLALGLILLVSLFVVRSLAGLGTQPAAAPPENAGQAATVAGVTNTPQGQEGAKPAATTLNPPTAAPAATGKRPPACTFPLADIKPVESQPETYIFSEPQIVLSHPENLYDIVEWLPDNQQVLVTQDLNNARENGQPTKQSIELYNPETGDVQVYAIRYRIQEPPLWHPELRAVVYPTMNFMGFEENENKLKFTRQAWVSYGNPDAVQMLADNLEQFPLSIKPGNGQIVYLSDKKIFKKDGGLKDISSVTFDLAEWDYATERKSDIPISYSIAWQPGTSLIFLYGDGVHRLDGYTYILDTDRGQICELNLGGWATKARWSSDGRYLAIIRTNDRFPINSSDLTVLDTVAGNLYTVDIASQKVSDKHFIDDIIWAPDNRQLLVVGSFLPYTNQSADKQSRLYLVDFISGQNKDILPRYTFYAASSKGNLAWSPDGSKILVRCPTLRDEQICFIIVQRSKQ